MKKISYGPYFCQTGMSAKAKTYRKICLVKPKPTVADDNGDDDDDSQQGFGGFVQSNDM